MVLALAGLGAAYAADTLTVEVFDRTLPGFTADNNFQTRYFQENVKRTLGFDVKFITVPRGQEIDKLNVLMAAGQAPDISFTYNEATIMNYIKSGGQVIPMGLSLDPNNIDWTSHMLVRSFVRKESPEDQMVLANEGKWIEPGYKEGIRMLNKMYNAGLLSTDFVLDKDGKQYEKDVVQGRIGAFIHNYDQPYRQSSGWLAELSKNVPGAKIVPMDPFANWEGKHAKMKLNPVGLFLVVPTISKNAVHAIKYMNWMASDPMIIRTLQNGVLGIQYLDEKNGIPVNRIPFDKLPDDQKFQWVDFSIIVNGYEFMDQQKNIQARAFFPHHPMTSGERRSAEDSPPISTGAANRAVR